MHAPSLLMIVAGYLSGSLMFSLWLARLRGGDVRSVGDRNPGAVNAFKAAGPVVGVPALLLDFLKGAVPVAIAIRVAGVDGWWLVPVMLAPVLGHAFPALARLRGGKALAVTFGVWAGVTLWEVPCAMGLAFTLGKLGLRFEEDAHSVLLGMSTLVIFVILRYGSAPLIVAALLNAAVVIFKHRRELSRA